MTTAPDAATLVKDHPDPGNRRKHRADWHGHAIDLLTWPFAFLLDRNDRLATSKVMAFAIFVAFVIGKPIPVTVVIALLAASFGYTAWKDFVAKGSWGTTSRDSVALESNKSDTHVSSELTEKRTVDEHYTNDGVPRFSNAPVAGATTPAGES